MSSTNNNIPDNQMETFVQEMKDLFKEFGETKKAHEELTELLPLLQEELRVAREAERNADFKKARCQAFLNQQQEIIQRLLAVKEENENLKCKLNQTEITLSMVQNNSIEIQMRNDAKVQEIEQVYLKKIAKVKEDACQQAEKEKSEHLNTIRELKETVFKLEEKLEEKDAVIISLQVEVQTLKDWSSSNIEAFHEKLAEQERKHQSELETWKVAELNRSMCEQAQQNNQATLYGSGQNYQNQHQPPQVLRTMQGYQPNVRFQEQISSYQKTPLVTHYKNVLPRHNTNMVRPLTATENYQQKSDFVSANDLYMQSHLSVGSSSEKKCENGGEKIKENKQVVATKPNILVPKKKRKLFSNNHNML